MALRIYRRHSALCSFAKQKLDASASNDCPRQCPIWVGGSLRGTPLRRSLGLTDWDAAAYLVHLWEVTGDPDVRLPVAGSSVVASPSVSPPAHQRQKPVAVPEAERIPSIAVAVKQFMASLETRQLTRETVRKYETLLLRCLLPWCRRTGISALADLRVVALDDFTATWTGGPLYRAKNLERLRAFCQFCVNRDWIPKNPAQAIRPPRVRPRPTIPFTPDEMSRIFAACHRYCGNRPRVLAFVFVLRYSGLRISDAVVLTPDHLIGDRLRLYTAKTGEPVLVPLPPIVTEALQRIERPGQPYFSTGHATLTASRGDWARTLASLFAVAEVKEGHSSRFRHTFSTTLLEQGVSVETVAMLLGNTPAIVIRHYSPWIKARQEALEAAVRLTWPA
jgi:integrase